MLEAGEREWAGDEEAGGGRGDWGRLMGVERPAVVLWRAEAIAVRRTVSGLRGIRMSILE